MSTPHAIGPGPFTRQQARAAGITDRRLQSRRFVRIYPRVWRRTDHEMSDEDWRAAALLALPASAHLTGITRLQQLGLDFGPRLPVRCVIQGTLHLAFEHVFLHRTKKLPPLDDVGVTVEAAYVSYCATARVIDAIKVGDWLLHRGHLSLERLVALATSELWRPGSNEALWVLDHLDARSRSLMESELRSVLEFAGLPEAESNAPVDLGRDIRAFGDLVYQAWRTVVEYESLHHQVDRDQYRSDLDRYSLFREHDHAYVQITREHLDRPKRAVGQVYRALVRAGYDGPPPTFGEQWRILFAPLSVAVGPGRRWEINRDRAHTR